MRPGSGTRVGAAALLAASLLVGGAVVAPAPATTARAAGPQYADPHFRESKVVGTVDAPIVIRFATDERVYVAQKNGVVKAFDSIDDTTPTTVIDLATETNSYWDRGLLGMALDPDFLGERPYLYLYYVYDAPPGGTAPVWSDACPGTPTGPGGTADGCVVTARLDRYTVDTSTNVADPGSRVALLGGDAAGEWCAQYPSHSGGGLAFGPDGALYLAGGDGASFTFTDYGQGGGRYPSTTAPITPVNPCGDPVTVTSAPGDTPAVDAATAEGGMLRSQDVRSTGDPTGLGGSLIRIDPDTGDALSDNPLANDPTVDDNARRIVAHGFRNPFRLTIRPGTGELYVGDVGNQTWEEVERVVLPGGPATATTLPNFGWPCYEGAAAVGAWSTLGSTLCAGLYAQGAGAITPPVYAYNHRGAEAPCGTAGTLTTASITALAFYTKAAADQVPYPDAYDGALFLGDYSRKCLAVLFPGPGGVPDPASMQVVATGIAGPVDLVAGPHGDLYYADLLGDRVVRLRYITSPVAVATATPAHAIAPVDIVLDGSDSVEPNEGYTITDYAWDLDDDGSFETSGNPVPLHVPAPAVQQVHLRVTSSSGYEDTTSLTLDTTNSAPATPVITADTPSHDGTWAVGDEVTFAATAHDPEDGDLPASALTWDLSLLHCYQPDDCHEHPLETLPGVAGGSIPAPEHEYPSRILLTVTATDSMGVSSVGRLELGPQAVDLTVASTPAGVPIAVNAGSPPAPSTLTVIRNSLVSLVPPGTWDDAGTRYRFSAWNDGGTRIRDVTVTEDTTYTAAYVPDAPDACAAAAPVTANRWVTEHASGAGDQDWFRFSLTGTRTVILSLGDLPVDARLELYGACGAPIATSDHGGTRFEELTRRLAKGTYRVRVTVPADLGSPMPYVLRVRPLGSAVLVKSVLAQRTGGSVRVVGEVLNARTTTAGQARVTATFKDGAGKVVKTLTGGSFRTRIPAGSLSPFVLAGTVPAYATVTYAVTTLSPTASRSLTVAVTSVTANGDGTATERGTVRNTGRTSATSVAAARAWYGRRGEVLAVGTAATSPTTLAAGRSGTFTIIRPALAGVQASRTFVRGR